MNLICNKASYDLSCKNILHYSFFILTSSLQAKRSDYTYDQVGNRLTYDSKYGKITYEYDDNSNRLTRVNFNRENDDLSYILINYDANGNTIQRDYFRNKNEIFEQELYEYNYDNMMEHYVRHKPVMKNNRFEMEVESELNMKYDVNGMRVIKECYPNTSDSTIYIYEGSKVVLEMTYEQIPKNKLLFTYAGEKKVSRTSFKEDGTIDIDSRKYFHQNFLGSIAMITDKDGNIEEHNKYEPFGDVIWSKSYIDTGNNYKFTGKERDKETNLDYFNARYLDTKLGRFMKPDILKGSIFSPQTLNRFIYCVNNPIKYLDPTGMIAEHRNKQGHAIRDLYEQIKDAANILLDIRITRLHTLIRGLQDEVKKQLKEAEPNWDTADSWFEMAVDTLELLIPEIKGHEWKYDVEAEESSGQRMFLLRKKYELTIGLNQSTEEIISDMIHEGTEAYMRGKSGKYPIYEVIPHNYAILMEIKYSYISKYNDTNEIMGRYRVTYAGNNTFISATQAEDRADLLKEFKSISNDYYKRLNTFNKKLSLYYELGRAK